jgi:hypothetical protein
MTRSLEALETPKRDFDIKRLDLARLVGFQLKVYSDQLPGKELRTRVVSSTEDAISVEAGQPPTLLESLVHNQKVILQFPYRGQDISVRARLRRTDSGRCSFVLDDTATPLSQRRFQRVKMEATVTLAPFPAGGLNCAKLGRLRWMQTDAVNFSAGGALIVLPTRVDSAARLLINMQQDQYRFPSLILAKVRHSYQADESRAHTGVEFVTTEAARRIFSTYQMTDMPSVLFSYSNADREQLNRYIKDKFPKRNAANNTGVKDEDQ